MRHKIVTQIILVRFRCFSLISTWFCDPDHAVVNYLWSFSSWNVLYHWIRSGWSSLGIIPPGHWPICTYQFSFSYHQQSIHAWLRWCWVNIQFLNENGLDWCCFDAQFLGMPLAGLLGAVAKQECIQTQCWIPFWLWKVVYHYCLFCIWALISCLKSV